MCIDYVSTRPIRTSLANIPPPTGVMSSVTHGYGDSPVQLGLGGKPPNEGCKQNWNSIYLLDFCLESTVASNFIKNGFVFVHQSS